MRLKRGGGGMWTVISLGVVFDGETSDECHSED